MIEKLKETYIRPVYEIGIVATTEEQLENFIRNYLKSSAPLTKYEPLGDLISSDNFTNEIYSIPDVFTIYEKYERQFIYKQDRFRAIFFPIICARHGSLGRDELQTLEGFIFLSPEFSNDYGNMAQGVDICATVLDDHFYSSKHFVKDEDKEKFKDRGLGFVKSKPKTINATEPSFVKLRNIYMPVSSFGIVAVEEKVSKYQEESLVECLTYIASHSKRCLDLDHSLSLGNKKENNEDVKGSQKLFEKITTLIKLKDNALITTMKKLFRNRFDYYNLLATDNLVYMTKRLCFFHIPLGIQVKLLQQLYRTLVKNSPSLSINDGKVNVKPENEFISVKYKQLIASDDANVYDYYIGSYKKKKTDIRMVTVRFYYGEKIEFHYEVIGKYNPADPTDQKCSLQ